MIEKDIHYELSNDTDVKALVSTRVYPLKLPQGWTLPAITYQLVSNERAHTLAGPSGRIRPRFQIDCWDDDYEDVKTLATAVRQCLDGFKDDSNTESDIGGITLVGERDIWEEQIKLFRISMDFIIPHFETP